MSHSSDSNDRERLLRYLEGDLSTDERARIEARLADEPDLHRTLERLRTLRTTVQDARGSFSSGFSGRVIARIRDRRADPLATLYEPIRGLFLRLALTVLLLIGGLGTYNAVRYQDVGATTSTVEAALGLPDVTYRTAIASEWDLDTADQP